MIEYPSQVTNPVVKLPQWLRSLDDAGDFDCMREYPVNHNERKRRKRQFACALHPALSAAIRKACVRYSPLSSRSRPFLTF